LKDNFDANIGLIKLNKDQILKFKTTGAEEFNRFELIFEPITTPTNILPAAEDKKITLFPNPANGDFYVRIKDNTEKYTVTVTSISGKEIFKKDFNGDDYHLISTNANSGVYFVTFTSIDGSIRIQKIIIK